MSARLSARLSVKLSFCLSVCQSASLPALVTNMLQPTRAIPATAAAQRTSTTRTTTTTATASSRRKVAVTQRPVWTDYSKNTNENRIIVGTDHNRSTSSNSRTTMGKRPRKPNYLRRKHGLGNGGIGDGSTEDGHRANDTHGNNNNNGGGSIYNNQNRPGEGVNTYRFDEDYQNHGNRRSGRSDNKSNNIGQNAGLPSGKQNAALQQQEQQYVHGRPVTMDLDIFPSEVTAIPGPVGTVQYSWQYSAMALVATMALLVAFLVILITDGPPVHLTRGRKKKVRSSASKEKVETDEFESDYGPWPNINGNHWNQSAVFSPAVISTPTTAEYPNNNNSIRNRISSHVAAAAMGDPLSQTGLATPSKQPAQQSLLQTSQVRSTQQPSPIYRSPSNSYQQMKPPLSQSQTQQNLPRPRKGPTSSSPFRDSHNSTQVLQAGLEGFRTSLNVRPLSPVSFFPSISDTSLERRDSTTPPSQQVTPPPPLSTASSVESSKLPLPAGVTRGGVNNTQTTTEDVSLSFMMEDTPLAGTKRRVRDASNASRNNDFDNKAIHDATKEGSVSPPSLVGGRPIPFMPPLSTGRGRTDDQSGQPPESCSIGDLALQMESGRLSRTPSFAKPPAMPVQQKTKVTETTGRTDAGREAAGPWASPARPSRPNAAGAAVLLPSSPGPTQKGKGEVREARDAIVHKRPNLTYCTDTTSSLSSSIVFSELQLVEVIGGGGFGQVWKAMLRGTPVAVKVLTGSAQREHVSKAILEEFAAEINMLKGMRHPNICLYMGACVDPPNRAIVTELAANGSLWDALRLPLQQPYTELDGRTGWPTGLNSCRKPTTLVPIGIPPPGAWPWHLVKRVACGAARGMTHLHSGRPPVLHRDLKSANLLLDESYTTKVCDFGLSRLKAQERSMTGNCGTVQWMAPEILANQPYAEPADVFSFGVILWELLTKECPYDGMKPIPCAMAVLNKDARPEIPMWCPRGFRELIEGCFQRQPERRPTFAQIIAELDAMP